ncbi:hypothetical protein F4808DRAFT_193829 [Astrocystis sublimbata]|nr:hypothetical protein F4808DRAFT_193829 [Astrocystis sublimbata]
MSQEVSFLVAFATVVGMSEAIKQIQSDARKKEHRSRKNNLIVHCLKSSQYSSMLEGRRVVLSGDKLYVDTGTRHDQEFGHPFAGYYLPYPESNGSGLVTTICDEPPIMNWIYVDRWSYELKFGNRAWADDNWPVPWDCSRQDRRLIFGGWEGFLAVKEGNFWALYFDIDNNHLKDKVPEGTPVLEITLQRVEMRLPKPKPPPPKPVEGEGGEGAAGAEGQAQGEGEGDKSQPAEGEGEGATSTGTADANANAGGEGEGSGSGEGTTTTATTATATAGEGANGEQPKPNADQGQGDGANSESNSPGPDKAEDASTSPNGADQAQAETQAQAQAPAQAQTSSAPATEYRKPTAEAVEDEEEPLEGPPVD